MRVLQLHTRYRQPGGEDAVVDAEAELLRRAGHEVVLAEAHNPRGPRAMVALLQAPWNPGAARDLNRTAAQADPDVVHVHNTWFAMSPAVLPAAASQAPVVMTLHNYRITCSNGLLYRDGRVCEDCVGSHPWHGVAHACYRDSRAQSVFAATTIAVHRQLRTWHDSVELFLAMTPFARERFIAAGLPADRIRVKPHFTPDPGPRAAPPSVSNEVVYVGRLAPEKGVGVLLAAMAAMDDSALRLLVIGDGPELANLRRHAPPNVTFAGACDREEVASRLRAARALLFPSLWYETFGLTMIEAMAAGLPVLASDLGGSPDVIGSDGGMTVEAGNVAAWASALRRLESDDLVDALGQGARQRWQRHYRPEDALAALESAYASARAGRGLGGSR